ncbi:MAG: hypothetical protein MJ197_01590 [Bacteroidales bacterium]|nr:hypothetical protein [Bacteroidales bacterium]
MKRLVFVASIGIASLLASCSSMYIPSAGNTPLLSKKGELQAEASLTTNSLQLSADIAYSDHIAAMGNMNFSYGNFTNYYDIYTSKDKDSSALADLTNYGKFNNRTYELGIGYYNMFNSERFKTEAFLGLGYCHATDVDDSKSKKKQEYDSKYFSPFAQINTGFTFKYCDLGLGVRFAPTFHSYTWEEQGYSHSHPDTEKFTMFHIEPIAFIRAGSERVRFVAKAGFSSPIYTESYDNAKNNSCNPNYINTTFFHFSMGVNVRLNKN